MLIQKVKSLSSRKLTPSFASLKQSSPEKQQSSPEKQEKEDRIEPVVTAPTLFPDDHIVEDVPEDPMLRELFELFLSEDDNRMSPNDFCICMLSQGYNMTRARLDEALDNINKATPRIDYPTFVKLMKEYEIFRATEDDVRLMFRVFDQDDDGFVTADELREIAKIAPDMEVTDEDIDAIIQSADKDGDGVLDINEFAKHILGLGQTWQANQIEVMDKFDLIPSS